VTQILSRRWARTIALVLTASQVTMAVPVFARQQPSATAPPADAPPPVIVNTSAPRVTAAPLMPVFSDPPTTAEMTRARVFQEPLLPVGGTPSSAENRELARLLTAYLTAGVPDATDDLHGFALQHSSSPWRASLLTDLGYVWRRTGRFGKAYSAWDLAWRLTKDLTDANGRTVADTALGELAELTARLGHLDDLTQLMDDVKGRLIQGAAAEKVSGARQAVWFMNNEPGQSFRCGPLGLDAVLRAGQPNYTTPEPIRICPSTKNGTSLLMMRDLAREAAASMVMGRREPGAVVIVPALIHWNVGHFAALVEREGDRYLVHDPTFGNELWVTQAVLDQEATGYFLVRAQPLPAGWRAVSDEEGSGIWGKGYPAGVNSADSSPPPPPTPCDGMAVAQIGKMLANVIVQDTPLWYAPPKGPRVAFELAYNSREAFQPQTFSYSNLGPKWTVGWLSYVTDDPSNPSAAVTVYLPKGGVESASGYNATTHSYAPTTWNQAVITRTSSSPIRYERQLPDGSVQVFAQPDGVATFPRNVFMTEWHDAEGNANTFAFDASLRLTAVTDALGQVTTLAYGNADPLKITQVTDPFGRSANFTYDSQGHLASSADLLGLTSSFTYDSTGVVAAMTTPYGTTTATWGEGYLTRWVELADPLGGRERAAYGYGWLGTEPVPTGMQAAASNNHHNTLYWGKRAMATAPGDPAAGTDYFWALTSNGLNQASSVPLSVKAPLERRVYYSYQGGGSSTEGTVRQVTGVGRVLDDGTSQVWTFAYNSRGRRTQAIDPLGRETDYVYDATGLDVTQIKQKHGAGWDILESRTYNTQHEPLTVTDAAGQTTTYAYNSAGQVLSVTNAKGEATTYAYNGSGYLLSITGALSGSTTTFTYDGYGRVNSITDAEGYSLALQYDAAGRVTRTTYPDGTYEQTTYNRLDPKETRDRLGRVTAYTYNATRQLVATRDPLGRTTSLDRCPCGALDAIVDASGHRTHWDRDLEGRIVAETRPDAATTQYQYEPSTSRLKQVTDRKSQVTTYAYLIDDALQQKTYTNATVTTPAVSFTYDALYPRVATMVDGTGTTTYSYHPVTSGQLGAGQLSSVDGALPNDTISYTYDELGRVASRAINGVAQSVTYDGLGRTTTVTNVLGSFGYAYVGNSGRLATLSYPNGQTSTYSYFGHTGDDRLQTILHQRADTTAISRFDYAYDGVGNIASWTREADAAASTQYHFAYDAADQVLGATKQTTDPTPTILARYRYAYDPAGNRTSEQIDDAVIGASYNSANELVSTQPSGGVYFSGSVTEPANVTIAGQPALVAPDNTFAKTVPLSAGTNTIAIAATDPSGNTASQNYQVTNSGSTTSFTYDANGNLTADGTRTFTWDAEDRLVGVNVGTHRSEFTYDGFSRRVEIVEKDGGTTTSDMRFVWCGLALCEARDASSSVLKRYFAQGVQDGGTAYFYTRDHLGSVRELTDSANTVRARYDYDAWGRRTKVSGDRDADIGYTSHYQHSWSSLILAPYRAYDSTLGEWISDDPAGTSEGPNLRAYLNGNPLGFVDFTGEGPTGTAVGGFLGGVMGALFGTSVAVATDGVLAGDIGPAAATGAAAGATIGNALEDSIAATVQYFKSRHDADEDTRERHFKDDHEKSKDQRSRSRDRYPTETDSDDRLKDLEEAQRRRGPHIESTDKSKQRADQERKKPKGSKC
jgi:RHS repeat-associated protein